VLVFVEDGYEDMELMYPKYRMREAGYKVVVAVQTPHITNLRRMISLFVNMHEHVLGKAFPILRLIRGCL
jgi:putative intracellular protease/amidase